MIRKATTWTVLIYGILILCLGYFGYQKSTSIVSLYAGVGFGLLLILSASLMFFNVAFAAYSSIVLTLLLTATFAIRYSISKAGFPAIMAVLSGGMLLYLLLRVVKWKK